MSIITEFYNLLGSLACHQLPERTISASGIYLPVCARDTGIYIGIFVITVFAAVSGRFKADRQPSIIFAIILCLFMLPMIIDGMGSYMGFFQTNNINRLLTGSFFGMSLQIFLLPVANFKIDGNNKQVILKKPMELAIVISTILVICMAVILQLLPYLLLATMTIVAFVFLVSRIVFTIFSQIRSCGRRLLYIKTVITVLAVMTVMYFLSAYILQPLKHILLERG